MCALAGYSKRNVRTNVVYRNIYNCIQAPNHSQSTLYTLLYTQLTNQAKTVSSRVLCALCSHPFHFHKNANHWGVLHCILSSHGLVLHHHHCIRERLTPVLRLPDWLLLLLWLYSLPFVVAMVGWKLKCTFDELWSVFVCESVCRVKTLFVFPRRMERTPSDSIWAGGESTHIAVQFVAHQHWYVEQHYEV